MTAQPEAGGFSQDGNLDTMKPSAELARILEEISGPDRRCAGLTDDQIIGVLVRWQALEAWATAGKLGAIVALLCRRGVPELGTREPGDLPRAWTEDLNEEVAMALAVSARTADKLIDLGWRLQARLPLTGAALNAGVIDGYKAQIIADETAAIDDPSAAEADPQGAEKRREEAERDDARVAVWREPAGTAAIAAFGSPAGAVLEAEQAIQDQAAAYKKAGITGTMDQLRNRAMIDKLLGTDARGPEFAHRGAARSMGGLNIRLNMILPVSTLSWMADNPGQIPGWGPIDPGLARDLAARAAAEGNDSEWHLTLTDEHGWAIGHGCAQPGQGSKRGKKGIKDSRTIAYTPTGGEELAFTIHPIPVAGECDHRYQSTGHDPSPLLRHLAEVRDGTCTRPGCARPATRCDFEHTVPFEQGGRTCLCNGNPKCRHDHQVKQARGWLNVQILPGFHSWTAPSGRTYTRGPVEYPT